MKKKYSIPLLLILLGSMVIGGISFSENETAAKPDPEALAKYGKELRKADLKIDGMFCIGCSTAVVKSLTSLPGVVLADANSKTDTGWVVYDPEKISIEKILALSIFQTYSATLISDEKLKELPQKTNARASDTTGPPAEEIPQTDKQE